MRAFLNAGLWVLPVAGAFAAAFTGTNVAVAATPPMELRGSANLGSQLDAGYAVDADAYTVRRLDPRVIGQAAADERLLGSLLAVPADASARSVLPPAIVPAAGGVQALPSPAGSPPSDDVGAPQPAAPAEAPRETASADTTPDNRPNLDAPASAAPIVDRAPVAAPIIETPAALPPILDATVGAAPKVDPAAGAAPVVEATTGVVPTVEAVTGVVPVVELAPVANTVSAAAAAPVDEVVAAVPPTVDAIVGLLGQ